MNNRLLLLATSAALVAGCAYPNAGNQPSATPPQLVMKNDMPTWDNPGAFGPVPESKREAATQACSSLNKEGKTYEARGFHPKALNKAGVPFTGGGFYCTSRA